MMSDPRRVNYVMAVFALYDAALLALAVGAIWLIRALRRTRWIG